MKDQFYASASDLRECLNQEEKKLRDSCVEQNFHLVIQALSKAIYELQSIGIDVSLQLKNSTFTDSFDLVKKTGDIKGSFTLKRTCGILKVDQDERLITFCISEGSDDKQKNVLKMYISDRDFSGRDLKSDYRGQCYDFLEDPEAIHKFQKRIISITAQNTLIRENDIYDVFDKTSSTKLNKPVKLPAPDKNK